MIAMPAWTDDDQPLDERVASAKSSKNLSDIVRSYGIELKRSYKNELEGKCPFHEDSTPSFFVNDQKGIYGCLGCHVGGDAITFIQAVEHLNFAAAVARLEGASGMRITSPSIERRKSLKIEDDGGKTKAALKLWNECAPIDGTPAENYLRKRGITIPLPPTLRYGRLKHDTGQICPALVAAVCLAPSRDIVAIHRTFLVADGSAKIPLRKPRMMLGPVKGGAVRLGKIDSGCLLVAEGIETALSVMQATGLPAWAALSDGGIENLVLPDGLSTVIICADNDSNMAGPDAANRAFQKWSAAYANTGLRIKMYMPDEPDTDFNDMLQAGEEIVIS